MSCMLNAAVPRPTVTRNRIARLCLVNSRQESMNFAFDRATSGLGALLRASCFHSAVKFSAMVNDSGALNDLDQAQFVEIGEQPAECRAALRPCRRAA